MLKMNTKKRKHFRIISWGGVGDALLLTPAFSAIKARFPDARLSVFYPREPHRQIFRHNPHIDSLKKFTFGHAPFSRIRYRLRPDAFMMPAYGALYPTKFYQKHAMKIIGEMIGLDLESPRVELYLREEELAAGDRRLAGHKSPILMQTVTGCSANKNWPHEKWEALVASMPDHTFIQLGAKGEKPVAGAVDMTGLSFRESFAMMRSASAFVGVESCFAHASNAFQLPGVALFGPSAPVIWGHNNLTNLYRNASCGPCLDILLFEACPYGNGCMNFEVATVREALMKQLFTGKNTY